MCQCENIRSLVKIFGNSPIVDLTRPLQDGMPTYPTHPKYFQMRWCSMGDPAEMNQIVLGEHTGTHLDAPSHFVREGDPARKNIDEIALDQLVGRAVKLTFGPFPAENVQVTADEIRAWEASNFAIEERDIVLFDFQWGHKWAAGEAGFDFLDRWPGLSRSAAEYLAQKNVKVVGTDCISLDPGDGGDDLAAHLTLLPKGILILENVCNLHAIQKETFFMALPLKIAGGTGAPVRAISVQPCG
ncbi:MULTISPECIES: cyclase family protein [unclassified Rhizobium]|uniref:cyclase family protein n=1 Tax=unclassified Rhizobium TaxID=2613769 RepID=UPI0024686E99|nr:MULTISPECIES: cyclase family protein [unclassified Rhizobium]